MTEIIIAIALWCGPQTPYFNGTICKEKILACVENGLKPGDYESPNYLSKKLRECLKK